MLNLITDYPFLVRNCCTGVLEELLSGGPGCAGVAVLEGGCEEKLGCGKLGLYQISSNTFAGKFVSSVLGDAPTSVPPEQVHCNT
jgi:hypothetical protein